MWRGHHSGGPVQSYHNTLQIHTFLPLQPDPYFLTEFTMRWFVYGGLSNRRTTTFSPLRNYCSCLVYYFCQGRWWTRLFSLSVSLSLSLSLSLPLSLSLSLTVSLFLNDQLSWFTKTWHSVNCILTSARGRATPLSRTYPHLKMHKYLFS